MIDKLEREVTRLWTAVKQFKKSRPATVQMSGICGLIVKASEQVLHEAGYPKPGSLIAEALSSADAKYLPFRTTHEGMAVLQEEFDELKDAVSSGDRKAIIEEAAQVGAMAIKFKRSLCDDPENDMVLLAAGKSIRRMGAEMEIHSRCPECGESECTTLSAVYKPTDDYSVVCDQCGHTRMLNIEIITTEIAVRVTCQNG